MKVNFYKNKKNNDIYFSLLDINVDGENELITANSTEAATEKHIPVIKVDGKKVHVEVGSVLHPMTEEHHISFIALVTDQKVEMKKLEHTGAPKAYFVLADDEKVLEAYAYCNLHGLWVKKID